MKINKYFLLHNKKLKPWIKYWLYIKSKDKNYVLSDILEGTSFYLENSSNKNFNLFQINGNSVQDGTPTPTNPIEIESSGDGINLFDKDNAIILNAFVNGNSGLLAAPTNNQKSIAIRVYPNTTYTISGVERSSSNYGIFDDTLVIGTSVATVKGNISNGRLTFTTGNNSKWFVFLLGGGAETYGYNNVQLQKGSTATEFVPYGEGYINITISNSNNTQSQEFTIPCQQPMRSIGDIRDVFVKENGVWYERHYIASTVLDITKVLVNNSYTNVEYAIIPKMNDDIQYDDYNYGTTIFPLFTKGKDMGALPTDGWDSYIQDGYVYNSATKLYYWMSFAKGTGQTAIRQQLDGMIYNYVLSTPTDLLCTQEQIQALESIIRAYTYEPITNINSTDETPAYLKIQYYMEV